MITLANLRRLYDIGQRLSDQQMEFMQAKNVDVTFNFRADKWYIETKVQTLSDVHIYRYRVFAEENVEGAGWSIRQIGYKSEPILKSAESTKPSETTSSGSKLKTQDSSTKAKKK